MASSDLQLTDITEMVANQTDSTTQVWERQKRFSYVQLEEVIYVCDVTVRQLFFADYVEMGKQKHLRVFLSKFKCLFLQRLEKKMNSPS